MGVGDWVPVVVALATGTAIPAILDAFKEWRKGRKSERTGIETFEAKVDRLEEKILRLERETERARRRARLAVEWGHETRVVAISRGVPSADLPVLDFGD